ncbi:hypothetical protein GCM10020331_077590 [Ectobacillus funiculus]
MQKLKSFVTTKITIEEIKQLEPDAIVLSPGPGHPEDAGICVEVVQQLSPTIPILGICLGHQAMVHALGGKVVRANLVKHGKNIVARAHWCIHFSKIYRSLLQ